MGDFFHGVANVITLGGHRRLENARQDYRHAYDKYEHARLSLVATGEEIEDQLAILGEIMIDSFSVLGMARKIFGLVDISGTAVVAGYGTIGGTKGISMSDMRLESLMEDYSTAYASAGALGVGSAVAVGSWTLVGLVGSASTGTSIATLSGAAATNATLAWFGGGALAAGGAGIAGGTLVLGGIALAPVMAIATWRSKAKLREVVAETENVKEHTLRAEADLRAANKHLGVIKTKAKFILPAAEKLIDTYHSVEEELFPLRYVSFAIRTVKKWFGYPAFRPEELQLVEALQVISSQFVVRLRSSALQEGRLLGSSISPPEQASATRLIVTGSSSPPNILGAPK